MQQTQPTTVLADVPSSSAGVGLLVDMPRTWPNQAELSAGGRMGEVIIILMAKPDTQDAWIQDHNALAEEDGPEEDATLCEASLASIAEHDESGEEGVSLDDLRLKMADDSERIMASLSDPKWDFRTAEGISTELGIPLERVRQYLDAHAGSEILESSFRDRHGRRLYTANGSRASLKDFWRKLRLVLSMRE